MTSQGKITLVLALDEEEAALLRNANFVSRGFVDINGSTVEVFDATKTVVHTTLPQPNDWWTKPSPSITPFPSPPWTTTGPGPYTATYTPDGTGVKPRSYNSNVSTLMNAAYDTHSNLRDHYFENTHTPTKKVLKINVDKSEDVDAVRKMVDEYQRIEASKK